MTRLMMTAAAAMLALGACATDTAAPVAPAPGDGSPPAAAAPPAALAPNQMPVSRVIDLGQGVSMLMGAGGNLGMSVGDDGVFLIDDQFATNAVANLKRIEEIAGAKPKYLVNTHWHFDHAGGNAVFQEAGATVFAHENVRKRLSGELVSTGRAAQPQNAPESAWPVVTFAEGVDFHLNGQTIRAFKVPAAHTDGDVMVHFVEADVLHMGDTYMKDRFPFVDTGSGGTQAGFIAAFTRAIEIAGPNTKIIPGHGELANEADLIATLDLHAGARAAVEARLKAGDTLEQAIAAKPLAKWMPRFGGPGGFITDDAYVTVIYNELKG
jgi:cyclase